MCSVNHGFMYRFAKTSFLGIFVFVYCLVSAGCGLNVSGAKSESATSGAAGNTSQGEAGAGGGAGPKAGCGDSVIGEGENCDDGNNIDGDRCTKNCQCTVPEAITDGIAIYGEALSHCYVLVNRTRKFSEALDDCAGQEMQLASIASQSEINDIAPYVIQSTWIGGSRPLFTNDWKWESGEAWAISPCDPGKVETCDDNIDLWNEGEPSGDITENCIELAGDSDRFNNKECNTALPYLCESK